MKQKFDRKLWNVLNRMHYLNGEESANLSFICSSKYMSCTFQVHHRVRNLIRSELEADLDTQEDGENFSLSEKYIWQNHEAKSKGKDSSIYYALLEQKVEVILTADPTKVNLILRWIK